MCSDTLFAGLMTGTSLDGVDAVLARIQGPHLEIVASHDIPLPDLLRTRLLALCQPGDNEIDQAGACHRELGALYAQAVEALCQSAQVLPARLTAIGCHGQTVRHRPGGDSGFSLQLGCPDTLAVRTGVPVIHDFRNKDMVLGGQGAPLAPRFHEYLFAAPGQRTAVVNLGGIANVSLLDGRRAEGERLLGGFDTGPANTLLDQWHQRHQEGAFDRDGAWAAGGKVQEALLTELLADPYFQQPPPKSTGREYFNLPWLETALGRAGAADTATDPQDVQATLADLTARSVAQALRTFQPERLLVCGGGAHNGDLLKRLEQALEAQGMPGVTPRDTASEGLSPDRVEAAAFAWLAWAYWHRVPGNAPRVTGARRPAVLGHLCLP